MVESSHDGEVQARKKELMKQLRNTVRAAERPKIYYTIVLSDVEMYQ